MREVLIDFSEDSVVGGKQWEHDASELVITVEDNLKNADCYALIFSVAGKKYKYNNIHGSPIRFVLSQELTREVRCSLWVEAKFTDKIVRSSTVYISFEVTPGGKYVEDFMRKTFDAIEGVENRVEKVENIIKNITSFSEESLGSGLGIDEDGKVCVITANRVEEGNDSPISSDAVYQEVGNINALLQEI